MKRYDITDVPNELVKQVSVPEEFVEAVMEQLNLLPFVETVEPYTGKKTLMQVELSRLVEPSDLNDMEQVIRAIVEPESEVDDDAE